MDQNILKFYCLILWLLENLLDIKLVVPSFQTFPCPNRGNYVNFWIKLSTERIENKFRNQFGKFYYFRFSWGLQRSPENLKFDFKILITLSLLNIINYAHCFCYTLTLLLLAPTSKLSSSLQNFLLFVFKRNWINLWTVACSIICDMQNKVSCMCLETYFREAFKKNWNLTIESK